MEDRRSKITIVEAMNRYPVPLTQAPVIQAAMRSFGPRRQVFELSFGELIQLRNIGETRVASILKWKTWVLDQESLAKSANPVTVKDVAGWLATATIGEIAHDLPEILRQRHGVNVSIAITTFLKPEEKVSDG